MQSGRPGILGFRGPPSRWLRGTQPALCRRSSHLYALGSPRLAAWSPVSWGREALPEAEDAVAESTVPAETFGGPDWATSRQPVVRQAQTFNEGRIGVTDNLEASTSGRAHTAAHRQAYASVAAAPPMVQSPSTPATSEDLRFFTLGAIAAVMGNYLVRFIGTLPAVQGLVRRFIWRSPGMLSSLDSKEGGGDVGASEAGSAVTDALSELLGGLSENEGEPVEWVNMCWRKAWRVYQRGLERWLADLLQPVFDNLVADGKVPKFVQRLRIVEFTLDHEAPYFIDMRRRNSRKDSDLSGVVDVRYTGGARMLLLIECGTGRWRVKVPVMVSELDLECKMWIKLRLAPMCPYVGTLSLAFVGPPTIKVQLAPYNRVRLMRIPVLQPFLAKLLTVDLPALMTLPSRLEVNIPPAVTAVAEAAVGRDAVMRAVATAVLQADALEHALLAALPLGPQGAAGGVSLPDLFRGELQVTLRYARDLPVWGFPWQSDPYCRLMLGEQAVRSRRDSETSQASRHRAPVWNQEFQFLVEDPDVQELEVHIRDNPMTGRTEVGSARLKLADLPREGTLDVWLPVESSMPGERAQGGVQVSVAYRAFSDDDADSRYREAAAYAAMMGSQDVAGQITDVKSAAAASSRAGVAASAAATAVAVTKAAAARAAARLARGRRLVVPESEEGAGNGSVAPAGEGEEGNGSGSTSITSNLEMRLLGPAREQGPSAEEEPADRAAAGEAAEKSNGDGREAAAGGLAGAAASAAGGVGNGTGNAAAPAAAAPANGNSAAAEAARGHRLPGPDNPAAQGVAVEQLEVMAATMQKLTDEVNTLNAHRGAEGGDAAAAEAAAKAVAAAEALAVSAVAAGDVAAANAALQEAAAALESTAVQFAAADGGAQGGSEVEPSVPEALAGPAVRATTPEERAAHALAYAQAAAAAAAAALEAAAAAPAQPAEEAVLTSSDDDVEAALAPEAIPSTQPSAAAAAAAAAAALPDSGIGGELEGGRNAPWYSRLLQLLPMQKPRRRAADAVAEADGSAAIFPGSGPAPTAAALPPGREGGAMGRSGKPAIASDAVEAQSERSWWGWAASLLPWSRMDQAGTDEAADRDGGSGAAQRGQQQPYDGSGPLGDIIMSPDLPLEEIAAEVQRSWSLRDVHVDALVHRALAGRQLQSERPWLVVLSVMATSSAVLLAIVLWRITHGN